MKATRYLKFLPLVALFAFGVTLISLPKSTEATPLGAPTLNLTFVPLNGSTVVTAIYSDDTVGGSAVLSGTPALGTFVAGATVTPNTGQTVTPSGATVTVTEDADTMSGSKSIVATFTCTQVGIMTFTLTHGGTTSPQSVTLVCGDHNIYGQFPYGGYPYGGNPYTQYPYGGTLYPTTNTTMGVTVSASPATSTCASPSSVSISVRDQAGNPAANGTSVTVSASTGTVSPNVVSTTGGVASTTFVSPDGSNGTATITATSGTGTGYATVAFTCTSSAPAIPAAPIYTGPVGPVSILPPNTGDAGLADQARTTTSAGVALAGLSLAGLAVGAMSLRKQRAER
jgi:hypothetical protein